MKKTFIIHYISKNGWTLKDRVTCDFGTLKTTVDGMKLLGTIVTGVDIVTGKRYGIELTGEIELN